eukprot:TRINITY_DN8849_c0_g1_i1.p1 TRINITY_DN8849_c0_g1~~TRINITY_DN8849_c0_g1_i1.p1  ORF type:complete len:803 (+),score=136.61 TRINITY_DN8849_c0_g1_i1:211-2409(+)
MPPIYLPLTFIESLDRIKITNSSIGVTEGLQVVTKGVWMFRMIFLNPQHQQKLQVMVEAFQPKNINEFFAVEFKKKCTTPSEIGEDGLDFGWKIYDIRREMERQISNLEKNLPNHSPPVANLFRIADLNQQEDTGKVFETYPAQVVVPASVPDSVLQEAWFYRSRGRVPAISWIHPRNGSVLARCSQPLPGVRGQRSLADERLCAAMVFPTNVRECRKAASTGPPAGGQYPPPSLSFAPPPSLFGSVSAGSASASLTPSSPKTSQPARAPQGNPSCLQFFDARGKVVATAVHANGGGFENTSNYSNSKITFLAMENIHHVTDSWVKLRNLITTFNNTSSFPPGDKKGNTGFWGLFDASLWLLHIQRLLWGSVQMADTLERGESIVTHCTDGWDRTTQLVTTTLLLLDPYFRTVNGFLVLVEREWVQFGHKFAERSGHMVAGEKADEWNELGGEPKNAPQAGLWEEPDPMDARSQSGKKEKEGKPVGSFSQRSPIFIQWLDGVFQLLRQFPTAFEFTPTLLEILADAVYSCKYGTFLTNNERTKAKLEVKAKTRSLWTDILVMVNYERQYATGQRRAPNATLPPEAVRVAFHGRNPRTCRLINPFYQHTDAPLRPSSNSKRLVFWESFYLRYDTESWHLDIADFYGNVQAQRMLRHLQQRVASLESHVARCENSLTAAKIALPAEEEEVPETPSSPKSAVELPVPAAATSCSEPEAPAPEGSMSEGEAPESPQ